MIKNTIFLCFLFFSCKKNMLHPISEYPEAVRQFNKFEEFDNMKWYYYALIAENKTAIDFLSIADGQSSHNTIIKDTSCLSLNVSSRVAFSNKNDDTLSIYLFNQEILSNKSMWCNCNKFNPQYFQLQNGKIFEMEIGTLVFYANEKEQQGMFRICEEKLQNFPNIIRKYKDQLNPWLKIEAQRRGIID